MPLIWPVETLAPPTVRETVPSSAILMPVHFPVVLVVDLLPSSSVVVVL
jgi:hypothetical protein